jgi:hypothetical protein
MSDGDLNKISNQLDQLIALVALDIAKGMKQKEAILLLGSAKINRNLIAQVTGSSPQTVSVRLSEAKTVGKPSKKKNSKKTTGKK